MNGTSMLEDVVNDLAVEIQEKYQNLMNYDIDLYRSH